MEIWDIYDENRIKTGARHVRGNKLPDGAYHLVVHTCIFNPKGEMLIQLRSDKKAAWPALWDLSAGGCAQQGEDSRAAAMREIREELGLAIDLAGRRPHLTCNFPAGFDDVYLIETPGFDAETLHLQTEEVQAARWADEHGICRLLAEGRFIPYRRGFIQMLFSMREGFGSIRV